VSDSQTAETRQVFHLNRRVALGLAGVVAARGLALAAANAYQARRMGDEAVAAARRLRDVGDGNLALLTLNQHLTLRPRDRAALRLRAEILTETASGPGALLAAAKANEQLVHQAPEAPDSQDARRRLVDLYVRYNDAVRVGASTTFVDKLIALDSRYRAAVAYARQLIDRGARDVGAYRLLALALDGAAVPGDRAAIDEAVVEYRRVLRMDPADVNAAERLARLYLDRLKDRAHAREVLDDLLRALPRSVEVRLARHRLFTRLRQPGPAAAELREAVALAPEDVGVLIAASEDALRRGDTAEARRQVDRVPESARGELRVLMARGLVDFSDERPDEAVDAWRRGLIGSAGTDADVTWWLAYAMLQIGRVADAKPLIAQFRRLAGDDAPLLRLLQAQFDERTGRPGRAARALEQVRDRLDPRWEGLAQLALGRCYEALWDEMKAFEAYGKALQVDPAAVVPRLAVAKLKLKRRPDQAVDELARGLNVTPEDPALRVAMAGALLQLEVLKVKAADRRWGEFDRAWAAARASAPGSPAVALMHADRLSLGGRDEDAVAFLNEVAAANPRNVALAAALADGENRMGRTAPALRALDRAAAAAGDSAALRTARARVLTAASRGREARAALTRDIDKLPPADRPLVFIALGQFETARGDSDGARLAYADWSRLLPDDPRPRLVLLDLALDQNDESAIRSAVGELKELGGVSDLAYRLGRAKEALWERDVPGATPAARDAALAEASALVNGVLFEAPELPAAQMVRAQVLERQDKLDEATAAYERCWQRGTEAALPKVIELMARRRRYDALSRLSSAAPPGDSPKVGILTAEAFVKGGDRSQAAQAAEQVVTDAGDAAGSVGWQARMLSLVGRLDDAETALRAMAERRPDALEPWLALIRFQAENKRAAALTQTIARVKAAVRGAQADLTAARCLEAAHETTAAAGAFAAAVAARPEDHAVRREAARFFEQAGRPLEAEALLRDGLRLDPADRQAARQLAMLVSSRGADPALWRQAWDVLGPEPAEESAPEDRLARALVLSRCPDPARSAGALKRLEDLVADLPIKHPSAAAARECLAKLLLAADRPELAARYASVSASAGTDPASIALFAQALLQSKKPEAAEWQIDRLAALSPGDSREAGLRARAIWDRSRPVEAAAALAQEYTSREGSPGAEGLGREAFLLLVGMGPDSFPVAERLGRKLASKNPALSWMPALTLARGGHADEAMALLRNVGPSAALEDLREAGRVAMQVALAADAPATLAKAEEVLANGLKAAPGADELIVMMAMLRHLQGRYEEEVRLYQTARAHRPESYVVLNNLAWALCEGARRPAEAIPVAEEMIRVTGREPASLDTRGVILTRLGRLDEATADLEAVARAEPTALHHLHLARAYSLAGRDGDARKSRDDARAAGLSLKDVDPAERAEMQALLGTPAGNPKPKPNAAPAPAVTTNLGAAPKT